MDATIIVQVWHQKIGETTEIVLPDDKPVRESLGEYVQKMIEAVDKSCNPHESQRLVIAITKKRQPSATG